MNRPTLFVLIALNFLFITVLAGEWYSETETSTFEKKQAQIENIEMEDLPTLAALTETSEDNYPDLVDRPLFVSGRKPVTEPEPENTPSEPQKKIEQFVWDLTGIFSSPKGITAFFNRTNGKIEKDNYRKLKKGDNLDGWKIAAIHTDKVTLTQAEESKTLLLRKVKPKTASVPPQTTNQPHSPQPVQPKVEQSTSPNVPKKTDDLPDENTVDIDNIENP